MVVTNELLAAAVRDLREFEPITAKAGQKITGTAALVAIQREIHLLETLTHATPHPGIVNLINTYEDEDCIYMLMGLIPCLVDDVVMIFLLMLCFIFFDFTTTKKGANLVTKGSNLVLIWFCTRPT